MEKKLIIIYSIIVFGLIEAIISGIVVIFVIPDMIRLDGSVGTNFFNEKITYLFFLFALLIGSIQAFWGFKEYRKKKHKIPKLLLYKGIIFSIIMLLSLYYFLMVPLEKMVVASY